MKKRNRLIAIGAGIAAFLGLIGMAFASDDDGPKPPGPPKPPRPPGPRPPKPDIPIPKPRPGDDFDPSGPAVWISPDCDAIEVGARFWPRPPPMDRNPYDEEAGRYKYDAAVAKGRACRVVDVRGLEVSEDPRCTGLDYVDTLLVEEGRTDPIQIAQMIFAQLAPLCADADPSLWGEEVQAWYEGLVEDLTMYIEDKRVWIDEKEAIGWNA